ncbi:MAG: hypothetical protein LBQ24_02755 [Candidatus Peribacteria bacterium]|nr:hypothetical protein [Candidatus Peribacteria bacterium]
MESTTSNELQPSVALIQYFHSEAKKSELLKYIFGFVTIGVESVVSVQNHGETKSSKLNHITKDALNKKQQATKTKL